MFQFYFFNYRFMQRGILFITLLVWNLVSENKAGSNHYVMALSLSIEWDGIWCNPLLVFLEFLKPVKSTMMQCLPTCKKQLFYLLRIKIRCLFSIVVLTWSQQV